MGTKRTEYCKSYNMEHDHLKYIPNTLLHIMALDTSLGYWTENPRRLTRIELVKSSEGDFASYSISSWLDRNHQKGLDSVYVCSYQSNLNFTNKRGNEQTLRENGQNNTAQINHNHKIIHHFSVDAAVWPIVQAKQQSRPLSRILLLVLVLCASESKALQRAAMLYAVRQIISRSSLYS